MAAWSTAPTPPSDATAHDLARPGTPRLLDRAEDCIDRPGRHRAVSDRLRGRWTGASLAVLQPSPPEEVAALVTLASELCVPLVPQGGNSSMVGGATPPADGSALIFSLRRMNRVRGIKSGHAVAEAGVILETLHHAAAETGQRFPLTLGARGTATVGGLTSTNAGGTQVLRFGTMRRQIEGSACFRRPNPLRPRRPQEGGNAAPSIDHMLIGAEGTLGIVTAVRLPTVAAVHQRACVAGLADPDAALRARALESAPPR